MRKKKFGLLGEKLSHSYSKLIHEMLSDSYDLIEVSQDCFDDFMNKKEFDAINVTIPYKEKVIPYLDEIDEKAKKIHAVNTIINHNGRLIGYNTDYDGFLYILKSNNILIENNKFLILGTGGTSKTAFHVLQDGGASLIEKASRKSVSGAILYNDLDFTKYDYIINTTPVGMYPNIEDSIVDINNFPNLKGIVDVIYNPLRTAFLNSRNIGIRVNGLDMLIYQAIKSHELFINKSIDLNVIGEIRREIKKEIMNIALIGMPGSGKSTIAKKLAEDLSFSYVDIDELIEENEKMSISKIFEYFGEPHFRELEYNYTKNASMLKKNIISCGGGVVKNKKNMLNLSANSIIIYLQKDTDNIIKSLDTSNRPLSKSKVDLDKLYLERKALYEEYADFIIDNNGTIDSTIELIKDKIEECYRK